jgi:hypothetical protein
VKKKSSSTGETAGANFGQQFSQSFGLRKEINLPDLLSALANTVVV